MALISMALPDEGPEAYETNPYGYSLCIRLNPKQCEALGIMSPPEAGTQMMMAAAVMATRVTQEVDAGEGEKEVYLELQITDMTLSTPSSSAKSATMLYGADTD